MAVRQVIRSGTNLQRLSCFIYICLITVLLAFEPQHDILVCRYTMIRNFGGPIFMKSSRPRRPINIHWRRGGPFLATLRAAVGERLGRLSDLSSAPGLRTARRQIRRWLSANGLTLLVVSAMMAIAWIVAER
jgi:hypothetical protein